MRQDRQVPYAVMNYREIVGGEYFFVDHTCFLRELERYKTPVFLRPKRSGKSLWVSLLEHYYDVRFKCEFQKLFGKTDAGREPTPLANSFLVLSLDELFSCRDGVLPYRSLRFEWRHDDVESYQDAPVVAYPMRDGYTRITEYRKLPVQTCVSGTTYAVEYPLQYEKDKTREPYYAVLTEESAAMYSRYLERAKGAGDCSLPDGSRTSSTTTWIRPLPRPCRWRKGYHDT